MFEKPQDGNPHRITVGQHVFPSASIRRFQAANNCVELFSKSLGRCFPAKWNNSIFMAQRVWDEKTENGIGKHIEDRFQQLAQSILDGGTKAIGVFEKATVEEFFSLWRTRHGFRVKGLPDIRLNGIKGSSLAKDRQEALEKGHVMFIREGGVMPGRFQAGMHVFGYYDRFRHDVRNVQWGVVRSAEGEFIVPDCFHDLMVVPVSPTVLIMAGQSNSWLTRDEVAVVNRCAIERSTDYYFARDLGKCPLINLNPPRLQRFFALDSSFE